MAIQNILRGLIASPSLILYLVSAALARETQYIYGTGIDGITQRLAVDRTPALYTGDFGDCLGGQSLFNITKFDAAYYKDNSTVLFHLDGASSIKNESLVMRFSMDAYGENRYQMVFDPCFVNIHSLCPLNSVPVEAWAVFPVGPAQVGGIPSLAFTIPDFEGSVRLQIFANSTRSQIGCFQASMTNGITMGHPQAISPVLALFTLVAVAASFVTAVYGVSITHMRTHYAHSISAVVILETFQSIFLSGALSLNFPSVLIAWWSNFAWSAAQIFSRSMIRSMQLFTGISGNAGQGGNAGSVFPGSNEGNLAQQIYGRSNLLTTTTSQLLRRQPYNASDPYDYTWAGRAASPGIPLPGMWTGFQGTLAALDIPAADAFTTALTWLSALLGLLVLGMIFLKVFLEFLVRIKRMRDDQLLYFRNHWAQYTVLASLRVLFMAFATMVTLIFYQFAIGGSPGVKVVAAISLLVFLLGIGGLATYSCHSRLRFYQYTVRPDRILVVRDNRLRAIPFICFIRLSTLKEAEFPGRLIGSIPFVQVLYNDDNVDRVSVHEDHAYIKRFGWLSARYRRTRWWFFGCSLLYQLFRGLFIGGAVDSPQAQVYGLLVFEVLALLIFAKLDPFEGQRNMALAVWMLGISKVLTAGLSIAFLPTMRTNRIVATAIGFVIIVVQGLVVVGLMILVVIGAISSYMSLTRNKEEFTPETLESVRVQYFEHLQTKAIDIHLSKEQRDWQNEETEKDKQPPQPSFSVIAVKRMSKIEDEDEDEIIVGALDTSLEEGPNLDPNRLSRARRLSRTNSVSSRMSTHSLPRRARPHRASWSSRDFGEWDALSLQRPESGLVRRLSGYGPPISIPSKKISPLVVEEEPAHRSSQAALAESNHSPTSSMTPPESLPNSTTALRTNNADSSAGEGDDMESPVNEV
ncbi:hypothetical protein N8I77_010480 [Diaporthe amygdali]|uniref:ML-like domain-containing protein n=1 Tax=Phomopsis amygdali TaxID=1214568 RepID=A0AAD9S7A3_PHOAM|nr:hypothetical protein N8I77_010480 [Diaporthe amygdali]